MVADTDMHPSSTIRTLIVDDEPLAVERLQILCAREPRIAVVGTANDGESALRLVDALKPDLILLDISMPNLDGMGAARRLIGMGYRPAIIFITAFDNFAIEAFDVAAVDYLLKPVEPERMTRAIDRVALRIGQQPTSGDGAGQAADAWASEFWVPHRSELIRIEAAQIDRIEAERDYMRLHVGARSHLIHQTISALEQRLDPAMFVRLHRSHIVRRDHIARLHHDGAGAWFATLACDTEIRIGRTFLPAVKASLGRS